MTCRVIINNSSDHNDFTRKYFIINISTDRNNIMQRLDRELTRFIDKVNNRVNFLFDRDFCKLNNFLRADRAWGQLEV